MRFRATIEGSGKTAAGIEVPPEVVAGLGSNKRPPVRVRIRGHTYRSSVAVLGGRFMLGISAENRAAAGVAAGDEVDVELELDTEPREVVLPPDFLAALRTDEAAGRGFDALNYSNRKRIVLGIEGAKTVETRQRRIEKAITDLREGRDQI